MASRSETDLLANALNALSSQAQGDIDAILETPDKAGHADGIAAVLLKYGSASGELGASMFDAWAEKLGIESPRGASGYDLDPDWAKKRVRWALSTKNRGNLKVLADELVKQPARDALASSAKSNGVRFARVPRGSETCAFCYMLASRGAVYHSEATAGKMMKFHGDCDCQIVPVRGPQDYPDGYDPEALYDDYLNSRVEHEDGSVDVRGTLSQMRLNLHDKLRDGVEPPEVKEARLAKEAEENLKSLADAASVGSKAAAENQRQLEKVRAQAREEAEELARQAEAAEKKATKTPKVAKPVGLSPADSAEWDQAVEAMKTAPESHRKFFMKHLDHLREKVASAVDLSGDDWYLVAKDKGPGRILRNPESVEGVVRNPATPAQEEALDAYLSPTYEQINGLLRGDKIAPEAEARAKKWIRDLDSYFENNATHLAGDHVMVRGLRKSDLPEGEIDRYVVGNTVVQKAYLSTASTESVASGFGGDVKLFIKAPDGQKYLSGVGFNNEAVFPRGMGLKVVAREDIPGLTTVYAELVDTRQA